MSEADGHREPDNEHRLSTVSLAVTAVVVVIMAIWGFNAATAPLKDDSTSSSPSENDVETCGPGEVQTVVKFLRSNQVVVSVYNAGRKAGRAAATLNLLEDRGFQPGAIGDASESDVRVVEIHAKSSDTTRAHLVALSFGKGATVVIDDEKDLRGQGVNVIIGDGFRKLKAGAPQQIKLPEPVTACE